MRPIFQKHIQELEAKDAWFRDVLSRKTTIDTKDETWAVAPEVGTFLYDFVLKHKPKRIVEVGMSHGYSTIWMAEAAQTYGGVIDTYETESGKIAHANIRYTELGYDDTISVHHMEALNGLCHRIDLVDLLFLDARKREYVHCLKALERVMPNGAHVIADDVVTWRRKLDDFFDYLDENKYQYTVHELGHGVLVGRK